MSTSMIMLLRRPRSASGEHWGLCLIHLPPQAHLLQTLAAFGRHPQKRRITVAVTETVQTVLHTMDTAMEDGITVMVINMDVSVVAMVVRLASVIKIKQSFRRRI